MKPRIGRKRISPEQVAAIHRDHIEGGLTILQVARKYDRAAASIRQLFDRWGLARRVGKIGRPLLPNGRFSSYVPLTQTQVDHLVASATSLRVPRELLTEWRHWPLARRAEFIRRIRQRLPSPRYQPTTPFSINVLPFAYGTPVAHEMCDKLNAGRPSRQALCHIKPASQGVIWNDKLWFWSPKGVGYFSGTYVPGQGRPSLHRTIWEQFHGRPVPPHCVVRYKDGNRNNLLPENLELTTKNAVCRENQHRDLTQKSRQRVALLLARAQKPRTTKKHDLLSKVTRQR